MQLITHWIDPNPNLLSGQQPVFVLERLLAHGEKAKGGVFNQAQVARAGTFWVPQDFVTLDESQVVPWYFTQAGDYVRIPVFAYKTLTQQAASVLATGLEIGLNALARYWRQCSDPPLKIHLVLGNTCSDLHPQGEDSYRCYVGLAIQTKE
jgi:hypothetical protein